MLRTTRSSAAALTLAVACTLTTAVLAGAVEERLSLSAENLELRHLIGEIRIEGHGGSEFQIEIIGQGKDLSAERLRVETTEGADARIDILFPLNESRHFVYPAMGGSKTRTEMKSDSGYPFSKKKIEISGRGSGLELWADVTIRVPAGKSLTVLHGVGSIEAAGVQADLDLDITSGGVRVARVDGSLRVDTGSGAVTAEAINGAVDVDTGSGHVELKSVDGDRIHVDTGSGAVGLEKVRGSRIDVDTGSGRVEATSVDADNVNIDTGSGAVVLELDRMGEGRFRVDTGSGSITLKLPVDASARLSASTGSGGIKLDLAADARIENQEEDEVRLKIGGGKASIDLDTGSGAIRVSQ